MTARYVGPAAIARCTYASVGIHDPPPGCDGRGGGLDGRQVCPPSSCEAYGSLALAILFEDRSFDLTLTVADLTVGEITATHVHAGGPGEVGPVVLDLGQMRTGWEDLDGEGIALGYSGTFPESFVSELLAGRIYVDVHTLAFPDGAIRGQCVAPPLYSNSGDMQDPFRVTRTGGHCDVDGDASDVQTQLGLGNFGWSARASASHSVADDFEVPDGQTWVIDGITLYLYQSNALAPTITSVDYAFSATDLLGQPPPAWTNVAVTPAFTDTFKKWDIDDFTARCERRLQRVFVPLPAAYDAGAGRHWLAWRAVGDDGYSGPWQAPVVIAGQTQKPGANALQSSAGGPYAYVVDGGPAATRQDFIFELTGFVGADRVSTRPGDMNCDGHADFDDINPFVLALTDPQAYVLTYPGCELLNADCNADGLVNFDDINALVLLLGSY